MWDPMAFILTFTLKNSLVHIKTINNSKMDYVQCKMYYVT